MCGWLHRAGDHRHCDVWWFSAWEALDHQDGFCVVLPWMDCQDVTLTTRRGRTHATMTTIQMTDDQLQTLIAALRPQPQPQPVAAGGPNMVAGAAAVVGTMPPCPLGKNKLKRYKKWCDWIRDAETKMTFLEMTTEIQKMNFIRSCAGPELNEFWLKEPLYHNPILVANVTSLVA